MRELVGESGAEIAEFMRDVMLDDTQKTRDRLDAARWLADRGFGRVPLTAEPDGERWIVMPDVDQLSLDDRLAVLRHLEAVENILAQSA